MKILIALDKFKGSISARDAINEISSGLIGTSSSVSITSMPISDGGGGALEILTEYDFTLVEIESVDALLDPKRASYALSQDGKNAFIEMASICGISDIPHLDAFGASSLGIGLAAKEAISRGARAITISLGGSASTDGGLGFLIGLGAIAKDSQGNLIEPNLNGLKSINSLSLDLIPKNISWTFLVDVANPLVGPAGSAYIFGPQKGLKDEELPEADALLNKWADLLEDISGKDIRHLKGAGAAGGVSAVGYSLLNAKIESGAKWLADLFDLEDHILKSDLVITGEGSFDEQSFMGKGPGLVIELARKHKKQIYIIAGRVDSEMLARENIPYLALTELAPSRDDAMNSPGKWLRNAGEKLVEILNL